MLGLPTASLYAAAAALVVILGLVAALWLSRHELATRTEELAAANRTIGQLQGAIVIQNAAVEGLATASRAAIARGAKAIAAAQAQGAEIEKQIASLRATPAPVAGSDVCKATDELILGSLHVAP